MAMAAVDGERTKENLGQPFDNLLQVFDRMVELQILAKQERIRKLSREVDDE